VNCIAAFNAGLLPSAVEALRAAGFDVDDADIAHVGVPVVLTKDPTDMHLNCVDVETSIVG